MSEQKSFRNNSPENPFPPNIDLISENALKDLYIKILASYKSSNQEKLNLMEKAKKYQMLIQELKNENELLKQTIETEKIKCEFLDKENKQETIQLTNKQSDNPIQNGKAVATNENTIKNLKCEAEKLKKDLVLAQAIAESLKTELENVKVLNENFKSENYLLNENLNNLKAQLEKNSLQRKDLQNQITKLNSELEKTKQENLSALEANKSKSASFFEKFKELSLKYENNNEATLSMHAEIHKKNEILASEASNLKKQLEETFAEKKEILSELIFERENVSHMQKDIEEKEDLIMQLQIDCKGLSREIKLLREQADIASRSCACIELRKIKEEKEEKLIISQNQIESLKNELKLLKSNFDENLQMQKKAIEELNKEIKAGLYQRNKLEKEIEMLASKLDLAECDSKNFSEYKNIFETEILILKENLEKLQQEKEMLVSSRNSTQNDFNQLSNQYNFMKERLENEVKLKSEDIKDQEKKAETLKKEIAKQKENKKNLHFKSLNDEDLVADLQNKITEFEIKEKEHAAKLNDIESLSKEKSIFERNLEESKKIIAYLENQIKELKLKTENLILENSNFKAENIKLTQNQAALQKEQNSKSEEINKKIIDDLNQEIKKINDLNFNLAKEKETLLSNSFNCKMEINSKQEMIEKIFKENKNLNDYVLKLQSKFLTLFSELKINLNKFFSMIKRDNKSIFTEEAYEKVNNFLNQISLLQKENLEPESLLALTANALNYLIDEINFLHQNFLEADNFLCKSSSMNQVDKMTIERADIENEKLVNCNSELLREIGFLKHEVERYKEHQRILNTQINSLKKIELVESNEARSNFEHQVKSLNKELSEFKSDYAKVKNEFEMILIEKKKLEEFLNIIAKNFPSKTISKLIFDFLSMREIIRKNELENKKIQNRILVLEQEYSNLNKEKAVKNSDLIKNVKLERKNLKSLTKEYEKKTFDKKEQIKTIEKDLINQLLEFKSKTEKTSSALLSNENNDFDKKSIKENHNEANTFNNKNASFHNRNNSEVNFNYEKNQQNSSFISNKTTKNPLNNANLKNQNLDNSNYAKQNAFLNSNHLNDFFKENKISDKNKNNLNTYDPSNFKRLSNKFNYSTVPIQDFYEYRIKYEDNSIRQTPDRQAEKNKSSISNLEITSIESLNNINLENFNSIKSLRNEADARNKLENDYLNRNSNINYQKFSEEQIINNEVYNYNIRKNLRSQMNKNINNNCAYNLTFKNDSENQTQENLNYNFDNNKACNLDYRNKVDNSLEDLMNLKSSELYKDNSLYLNSETKFNSGFKDSIEMLESKKQLNDFDNTLLNSNINFHMQDRYNSYK